VYSYLADESVFESGEISVAVRFYQLNRLGFAVVLLLSQTMGLSIVPHDFSTHAVLALLLLLGWRVLDHVHDEEVLEYVEEVLVRKPLDVYPIAEVAAIDEWPHALRPG
jgi:hypothetical protein